MFWGRRKEGRGGVALAVVVVVVDEGVVGMALKGMGVVNVCAGRRKRCAGGGRGIFEFKGRAALEEEVCLVVIVVILFLVLGRDLLLGEECGGGFLFSVVGVRHVLVFNGLQYPLLLPLLLVSQGT